MSTFRQILYHTVFGTKNRAPTLSKDHQEELYKFIWGVIKNRHCHLYRINGMEDHLHILSDLHPSIALADYIKEIKVASSIWMRESGKFPFFTNWQEGYGAFTCSWKEKDKLILYIQNQKEHHRTEHFMQEYKRLLLENNLSFAERYLF